MYLKEIQMENFKSFKKMRIPFLEGYTGITGPNGCGKSNIADAILFVLGPSSSRAIRAGRLTDLIFNGGKEKKPSDYCRVSLIFDNSDRVIPLDCDEVKLTRLVKLSPSVVGGYNSYFYVNGRKSKLSEFDSLLANARISADGYNLVQQGDVSKIVHMSNTERRGILEDIAGITKFDDDIAKAEKKRENVEENLSRIEIILGEIKKQIQQLDKDRAQALKYKEIKERLDLASAQMAFKKREEMERQVNSVRSQIEKFEEEKSQLSERRASLEKELEEARASLSKLEEKMVEKGGEEARKLKERMDTLRVERARAEDGMETSRQNLRKYRSEAQKASQEEKKLEKELSALSEEKEAVEKKLKAARKSLKEKEKALAELEERVTKSDADLRSLQKDIMEISKKVEEKEEDSHNAKLECDRASAAIERLGVEIAQLEEVKKTAEFELKDTDWQLKEARSQERKASKERGKLTSKIDLERGREKELRKQSRELEEVIKRLTREYNQLKAEAEAAESVRKGYTRAVNYVLDLRDTGKLKGIFGTIAELGKVDERYEIALNVAAGSRMQAIVVQDDSVAARAIRLLKEKNRGRAIFLPMNKMMGGRPRGKALLASKDSIGFAIDLIKFEEKFKNAFWYVLGDTVVVQNLEKARQLMGGVRIVTLDGELIEASGAMIGGRLDSSIFKFGAPDESHIEKVAKKLRETTEQAEKLRVELDEVTKSLGEAEERLRNLGGSSDAFLVKLSTLKAKRKEFSLKVKGIEEELQKSRENLEKAEKRKESLEKRISEADSALGELKSVRDDLKKKLMRSTPQELSKRIRELQSQKTALLDETNGLQSSLETVSTKMRVLSDRTVELSERARECESGTESEEKNIRIQEKRKQECSNELRALEKVEESMGKKMKEIRDQRDEAYRRMNKLENEIDKLLHKMETKEDFLLGLKRDMNVGLEKLHELEEEVAAHDIDAGEEIPPLKELRNTTNECEAKLEALGPVNMRALEDFEKQERRYKELKEELKRLQDQRRKLLELVKQLNVKKKDGLLAVLEGMNGNFKNVHRELSGGGEAELILENENNPFEGGLIIKARPKNKKFLRLEALSGGEKSLVSLAFIFALQQYDPSPFYFFDEIDQNLDAINAQKVAQIISRNSKNAQSIQISLRKVTLKEADNIIGVTMQESGISDVVMEVGLSEIPEEKVAAEAAA